MPSTADESAREMRRLLDEIKAAVATGELPPDSVRDLKRAIDETRTRVWASMEAAKSGDPSWVQEFWLQRAAEICRGMVERLEQGELNPRSARAGELRAAAARLASSLTPKQGS